VIFLLLINGLIENVTKEFKHIMT